MKHLLLLFVLLVAVLAITIPTSAQTITTFDLPGAVGVIQPARHYRRWRHNGLVTVDAELAFSHGLLRTPEGHITTFDVPDAAAASAHRPKHEQSGTIAGLYGDAADHVHGFVRDYRGRFTTVDSPAQFAQSS